MDHRLSFAFDYLGLKYDVRTTNRGVGYAGFRLIMNPAMGESAITAIIEEDVLLKLTVHDIRRSAELAATTAGVGALPLGNMYVSPESGRVELSVGLYIGGLMDLSIDLPDLLRYVDSARCYLEQLAERPALPAFSCEPTHRGEDIAPALTRYGHRPVAIADGAGVELKLDEQRTSRCGLTERPDGWYVATARVFPELCVTAGEKELALLQRLQRWTTAGRFQLAESGELWVEVHTPIFGGESRAGLVMWTATQALVMLRTAVRQLA